MKKIVQYLIIGIVFVCSLLSGHNSVYASEIVKIAVIGDSTYGIWEVVQENLGDEIQIELVDLSDPVNANRALLEEEW